jgi:hypothetical protein
MSVMTFALIRSVTDKLLPQRAASMPLYDDDVSDEYVEAQRRAIARVLPKASEFASNYDFQW